jgi:hypothetical protein
VSYQSSSKQEKSQLPITHHSHGLSHRPFASPLEDKTSPTTDVSDSVSQPANFSIFAPADGAPPPLQPKLTIGAPNDPYEQEADRVAAQVVQQINAPQASQSQALQRMDVPEEEELQMRPAPSTEIVAGDAAPELETAIHQVRGRGQALAPNLQAQMGQAMGADFSGVKIHTDSQSDQLNRSIQAKAFTTGQDIFFRQGAYQPGSSGGQELIAHELTHVVQQSRATIKRDIQPNIPIQPSHTLQKVSGLQRTTGTLIQSAEKLKVGTAVQVLKAEGLQFRIQDIQTGKSYWIKGKLTDYFKADSVEEVVSSSEPTEENDDGVTGQVAVLEKAPPQESVTEDLNPPVSSSKSGKSPSSKAISKPKKLSQKGKPGLLERLGNRDFPSMGRIDDPSWDKIEPLLSDYGSFTEEEKQKLKERLETFSAKGINIRGIPDLIDITFRGERLQETVKKVKGDLSTAAPDLDTWKAKGNTTITCGRGDTRSPYKIRESGGFFGWDAGVVTGPHARTMVKTIMTMSLAEQKQWISKWKHPTPDKSEANPWIASGIASGPSDLGGQKGGGEFVYELPLIYLQLDDSGMIVATDTGSIDDASVIGVRLGKTDNEIIMLTGVPWKYITKWSGSIDGKPPAIYEANAAADMTQ